MKTNYTDEQIQAAIDAAFKTPEIQGEGALYTYEGGKSGEGWARESKYRLTLFKSALDLLPEPPPPTLPDGKTPGQVAFEAAGWQHKWETSTRQDDWQRGASAVLAAFGGAGLEQAVARMEAVPWKELDKAWDNAVSSAVPFPELNVCFESVRARLIAAAREGFGPAAVDWKAKAEKAEAELARIVAAAHEAGWNGVENSKDLAQFIKDQEATLKKWSNYIHPEDHDRIVKVVQDRAKASIAEARQEGLSTLRPLSESGEMPAGAVRVFASKLDGWKPKTYQITADTHFADIMLPEVKAPAVEPDPYAELKAAHTAGKVIQWHNGHMWHDLSYSENPLWIHPAKDYRIKPAEPVKHWTPAVGDVVTLKSGGPKMTVVSIKDSEGHVVWFQAGTPRECDFHVATLQPA